MSRAFTVTLLPKKKNKKSNPGEEYEASSKCPSHSEKDSASVCVFNVICNGCLSAVDRNAEHFGDWLSAFLVQGHSATNLPF